MKKKEKRKLKDNIKQGDIVSLLTYLEMIEHESTEKTILSTDGSDFHRAQVLAFREVIALFN